MKRRFVIPNVGLFLTIVVLFASACSSTESENVPDLAATNVSDLGVRVTIPDSIYANCLWTPSDTICEPEEITRTLLLWIDIRVEEWIASRPDVRRDNLLAFARDLKLFLVDGWFLECDPGPGDLCSGVSADGRIGASIYNYFFSFSECPESTPEYLAFTTQELSEISGKDFWLSLPERFGCAAIFDIGLPSLVHELNNSID